MPSMNRSHLMMLNEGDIPEISYYSNEDSLYATLNVGDWTLTISGQRGLVDRFTTALSTAFDQAAAEAELDVGFHPDLAEESTPDATEADVERALNVAHPARPGFTPTHLLAWPDADSDIGFP